MARYPRGQPVIVSTTVRDRSGTATTLPLVVKLAQADGTRTATGWPRSGRRQP